MNKAEKITIYPVNGAGKIISIKEGDLITSISITCLPDSANPLLIGWNENASVNLYALPGSSYPYKPTPGNYLDGNEIRLKFGQIDGTPLASGVNRAVVTIYYEGKETIC